MGSLQKVEHSIKKLACIVHTTKIVMFLFMDNQNHAGKPYPLVEEKP